MQKRYRHFGIKERELIDKMRRDGDSIRQMARVLSRSGFQYLTGVRA